MTTAVRVIPIRAVDPGPAASGLRLSPSATGT